MKINHYFKIIILLIILFFPFPTKLFGKQKPSKVNLPFEVTNLLHPVDMIKAGNKWLDPKTFQICCWFFINDASIKGTPEEVAWSFLNRNRKTLNLSTEQLEIDKIIESPGGIHLRFKQLFHEIPVYSGGVTVSLNKKSMVTTVINDFYSGLNLTSYQPLLTPYDAREIAKNYIRMKKGIKKYDKIELVVFPYEEKSFLAYRVIIVAQDPLGDWEIMVDAINGDVLRVVDQMVYANGTGKVFNPDPLTTAQVNYGTPGYKDNNDSDTQQLNDERQEITLSGIFYQNNIYKLIGEYCTIDDLEPPDDNNDAQAWPQNTTDYSSTRSQQKFEAVMTYYYITESQHWIQSLGFTNIQPVSIHCDPHGLNGEDNSHYSPSGNFIAFGEGGVDDAEDADVILHEYGHAIQNYTGYLGSWSSSGESGALGEGFGDYWAGSYSKSVSSYNSDWVFNWDGHNEFWSGRTLNTSETYNDRNGDIYHDGAIWATTLMLIWDQLGKEITDRLVLQSHYYIISSGNRTLATNAQAVIQADADLYGGEHVNTLISIFQSKEFPVTEPSTVKVTVHQLLNDGVTEVGTIGRWNGSSFNPRYSVPKEFTFNVDTTEVLHGDTTIYSNQKYRAWKKGDIEEPSIVNHHEFPVSSNFVATLTSQFQPTKPGITIRNALISAPSQEGGTIEFKDPWLIDYPDPAYGNNLRNRGMDDNGPDSLRFWIRSSPFNPDYDTPFGPEQYKYRGVFLDQGWPGWNPPYYSIKAEAQQPFSAHNQDITGYFLGWEGTQVDFEYPDQLETPVVFHADGAEARAVYKGHLASSIARATGYNNGRKIAKDGSGTLHLVYEDDNKIWYTYSTDNGQHWSKEEKISDFAGNPSIAISNGQPGEGVHVHVVWETPAINQNGQEIHYISYSKRTTSGWSDPIVLSEGEYSPLGYWTGPDSRRPGIYAEGSDELFVTWNSAGQLKIINHNSYGQWSNVTNIPNAHNGYPDIVLTPTGTQRLRIVWADNGHIKYIGGSYSGNNKWSWTAVYTISNNTPPFFHNHNNPSVTVSGNDHFHVAWECEDDMELSKKILYQEYGSSSTPQTVGLLYSIASNDLGNIVRNVSIGSNSSGTISFHYEYLGKVYNKLKTGSSWSTYNRGNGKFPSSVFNDIQKGVWLTESSAPYLLKTENLQDHLAKSTIAEVESFKRFYYPKSDSNYFTVDLKEFTANGQDLTFYQNLNSDTIEINGLTYFEYQLEIGEDIEAGDLLSFWFVTDEQKYFLDEVKLDGDEAKTITERSLSFDPGKPSKGYVQIEFSGKEPFVINVVPDNATGSLAKNFTLQSESFVPQKFALKQNFPNPFNPVTQIQFDLPKNARVTLKVFDLSGHEVATLVNGYRSARRYQVVFDGRNLASGVYIYRLTTDKGFTQSRKMMLIK